eukprot:1844780-Rhodomonas_salina.1
MCIRDRGRGRREGGPLESRVARTGISRLLFAMTCPVLRYGVLCDVRCAMSGTEMYEPRSAPCVVRWWRMQYWRQVSRLCAYAHPLSSGLRAQGSGFRVQGSGFR